MTILKGSVKIDDTLDEFIRQNINSSYERATQNLNKELKEYQQDLKNCEINFKNTETTIVLVLTRMKLEEIKKKIGKTKDDISANRDFVPDHVEEELEKILSIGPKDLRNLGK